MPFPTHIRRRFTRPELGRIRPGQRGVFGIYNPERWLYVGSSDDIRASLIDLWEHDVRLDRLQAEGFTFEVTDAPRIREALLISELNPVLNVRHRHLSA
jgi:hypothetical protein